MKKTDLREKQIETLIRLKDEGMNIIYMVSDSVSTSKVNPFLARFPEDVVNVGIAEQNLIGIAAGFANMGFIPFTGNAAPFLVNRSAEQIKVDAGYSCSNVKLNGMHAGFSYGIDGVTHHEVNDISFFRGLPSFEIYAPSCPGECEQITEYAAQHRGPVYISLNTGAFPEILPEGCRFIPGKALQVGEGTDVTIIALGSAVHDAMEAAAALGHSCRPDIFALSSIRPLDTTALLASIRKTGKVITLEQHSTHGGCGSLIAEAVAENGLGAKLIRLGVPEGEFTKNASAAANKRAFGLDAEGIINKVRDILVK
jgi:transketolase